ncbi:acyltransferase family protein [uncultured Adlercreutzia sp.]|uniref:acyltransferase family protein n=1 Tax=uncultured Adlercreutzia sp. TaxID=875803 RepID=UPI0025D26DCD|nr:acyltransferase family protein [uncultured Adlercreutzia sp.]MCI9262449.1 acyltransferase [Eggerthellaceae bacterium]
MRSSNIELLRIASMFMIILFHFSVHGAWPESGPLASDVAVEMLSFGGKLGVNCFVLITGYFMVRSQLKLASLLRVLLETWFYSFVILFIFLLVDPSLITETKLRKAVLPVVSGEYWFITCYVALMVASPLLNLAWRHLSPAARSRVMAVGFVTLSLLPTASTFNPIGSDLVWFFYIYLLGGWVRERFETQGTNNSAQASNASAFATSSGSSDAETTAVLSRLDPAAFIARWGGGRTAIFSVLFVWASMAVIGYAQRAWGFTLIFPDYFIWQYMVPTFFASVGLLMVFQRLSIPSLKGVNTVAKTTLGIYLIHDNPIMRAWIWPHFAWVYDTGFFGILGLSLAAGVLVFAACSAIDFARITLLEKPFFAWLGSRFGPHIERAQQWLRLKDAEQPETHATE